MAARRSTIARSRRELESYIDQLISLLDTLDGDCDLEETGDDEPSLGGPAKIIAGKMEYDLEQALADEHGIADQDALDLFHCEGGFRDGFKFDGSGNVLAKGLIRKTPAADRKAKLYSKSKKPPLVYDFRKIR